MYIKNYFKNAKIGDLVYDIISGYGKIINIDNSKEFPLEVEFDDISLTFQNEYYNLNGQVNTKLNQCLFYKGFEPKIIIPEPPK